MHSDTTEKPLKTHNFSPIVHRYEIEAIRQLRAQIAETILGDDSFDPETFDGGKSVVRRAMNARFVGSTMGTWGIVCSLTETAGHVRVVSHLWDRTTIDSHAFARFRTEEQAKTWLADNKSDFLVGNRLYLIACSPRVIELSTL